MTYEERGNLKKGNGKANELTFTSWTLTLDGLLDEFAKGETRKELEFKCFHFWEDSRRRKSSQAKMEIFTIGGPRFAGVFARTVSAC